MHGYQWLREICSTKLLVTPIKLDGHVQSYKQMNHCSITSQRYIKWESRCIYNDLLILHRMAEDNKQMIPYGCLLSWSINHSCHRLHRDCTIKRPGCITQDNSTAHPSQQCCPYRQVGSIWMNHKPTKHNITCYSQSCPSIHWSGYQRPHKQHRELLELSEEEDQMHEGILQASPYVIFRRIYADGMLRRK